MIEVSYIRHTMVIYRPLEEVSHVRNGQKLAIMSTALVITIIAEIPTIILELGVIRLMIKNGITAIAIFLYQKILSLYFMI